MENPSSALSRNQFQSKKAMEKGNDRISQLPDAVLHYILSLMPMKFMVRTSILSRRWSNLWKDIWAYSTVLDFATNFATGQTPEEFVSTVNQYLQLHKAKEIEIFRVLLFPCSMSYADKWVKFAGAKGAKEVDIHFCKYTYDDECNLERLRCKSPRKLLNNIFNCDSITHLNLSGSNLRRRLNFKGYPYLKTLHLSMVGITNAKLENMLSNCPLMEELILSKCYGLTRVKVSAPNLPLKRLTVVDCWDASEIEIFAPNLRSFHFYGGFIRMYFKNILSLVDVLFNCMGREGYLSKYDWITVLHHLGHVKILTLSYLPLEYTEEAEESATANLPVKFHNLQELQLKFHDLQELQLLLGWATIYSPDSRTSFFKSFLCPSLEKLFIELPFSYPSTHSQYKGPPGEDPLEVVFDHLKMIKMNSFSGFYLEIQLVKFFLERAIVLESLVLVTPPNGVFKMKRLLRKRLSILAKASSSNARILVCEYSEDNGAIVPTHTDGDGALFLRY